MRKFISEHRILGGILLIIPFIGWIIDIIIRVEGVLKGAVIGNILMLVLIIIFGAILAIVDGIFVLLTGNVILG